MAAMNAQRIDGRAWARSFCLVVLGLTVAVSLQPGMAEDVSHFSQAEPQLEPLPEVIPAPQENPTTPDKVALGKQLFFDPRLSGKNDMSCATCHLPQKAFADGKARSEGADGKLLARNTPSVLNTGLLPALFWDGRAASLEEQALGPIQSPEEMNQNLDELMRELNAVPGYVKQFQKVFGTDVDRHGIARALAAFQRSLVSRNSPLDRYLAGDEDALSPEAQRGMELFVGAAGCIRCHHGPALSDGKFYRLGASFQDNGREAVTDNADDRFRFRTPPLREVARTAPYMHDGSIPTLEKVVEFYLRSVPLEGPDGQPIDVDPLYSLSYTDIDALVAFLKSLNGELPRIEPPQLP